MQQQGASKVITVLCIDLEKKSDHSTEWDRQRDQHAAECIIESSDQSAVYLTVILIGVEKRSLHRSWDEYIKVHQSKTGAFDDFSKHTAAFQTARLEVL